MQTQNQQTKKHEHLKKVHAGAGCMFGVLPLREAECVFTANAIFYD